MNKYYILLITLILVCFQTWAQTINITSSVTPTDQSYSVVSYQDKWHVVKGCSAKYSFEVEGFDSIASVTDCTYNSCGQSINILPHCVLDKGVLTISDVETTILGGDVTMTYDFELNLTVREKDKTADTTYVGKALDIMVYPEPKPSLKEVPAYLSYYKSTGTLHWEFEGTGGGEWKCTWKAGNYSSEDSSFLLPDYKGSAIDVELTANNMAPDGTTEWGHYTESWHITIIPEAVCTPTIASGTNSKLFQDEKWQLSVTVKGGNTEGWNYEWTLDGKKIDEKGPSYQLSCGTTSSAKIAHKIKLTVSNNMPKGTMPPTDSLSWTYTYDATFYPYPIVKFKENYPENICDGDGVFMECAILDDNGTSLNNDPDFQWSAKWDNSLQKDYVFVGHNPTYEDGKQNIVTCSVSIRLSEISKPYEKKLSHSFTVWPKPVVAPLSDSQRNLVGCGGNSLSLFVPAFGGQKGGWEFHYGIQGETTRGNSTSKQFQIPLYRPQEKSDNPEKVLYEVQAINTIEGRVRCDTTLTILVDVYPEPYMPDNVTLQDLNRGQVAENAIREGNTLSLVCEQCYGAYPSAWNYEWVKDGIIISTRREETIPINIYYSSDGMDYSKATTINCNVDNYYNDEPWAKHQYTKTLRVYHKPQTPTSLAIKGNGTSGTLIATTPVSDDALEGLDYYLVFGYRDANGQMHDTSSQRQQNIGQVRWSVNVSMSEMTTQGNIPYVYALWKYNDGAEITSGLCLAGSIDEQWDGSTYNGTTRAVLSEPSAIYGYQIDHCHSAQTSQFEIGGIIAKQTKGIAIQRMKDGTVRKIVRK